MGEKNSYHDERVKEGLEDSFYLNKKQAIRAAKELCYPPQVIEKLNKCTSIGQLSIVMATARQTYL